MVDLVCKSCSGVLERNGNYYVCKHCGSKWIIDVANDVNAVQRAHAWEALRVGDFEKASELFEEIILKDKTNYEAYWGKALAVNGILYVTDYNEAKKVPTCNNITEDSFILNKDVKKAIDLAPEEIKETYKTQAEKIEKIRIEWLEKASKEPPYDVFISYKDSDRENGLERTKDSEDVYEIYVELVKRGYNVFFSRETLRDKVSERYEPYIYNALKTAKVMIVFGEKAEYFNATWVKNEWTRFIRRIKKGEKHKNSLLVVYKNVDPYDIPAALTSGRQAIDYARPSNFELIMNHVNVILEESKNKEENTLDVDKKIDVAKKTEATDERGTFERVVNIKARNFNLISWAFIFFMVLLFCLLVYKAKYFGLYVGGDFSYFSMMLISMVGPALVYILFMIIVYNNKNLKLRKSNKKVGTFKKTLHISFLSFFLINFFILFVFLALLRDNLQSGWVYVQRDNFDNFSMTNDSFSFLIGLLYSFIIGIMIKVRNRKRK